MESSIPQQIGSFVIGNQLGCGSFGQVFQGHHVISLSSVAIKVIPKSKPYSSEMCDSARAELNALRDMDHPLIVTLLQCLEDDFHYYIILDFAENGSLFNRIKTLCRLTEHEARRYFAQMICTIDYLHNERKFLHLDIKPENILLDKFNNIRLVDFGLSCHIDNLKDMNFIGGSFSYVEPEIIKNNTASYASDIWSLGVTLYVMVIGNLPFSHPEKQQLLKSIINDEPCYPPTISANLTDLIKQMLKKDPAKRITIEEIKAHPWFDLFDYKTLNDFIHQTSINIPTDKNLLAHIALQTRSGNTEIESKNVTEDELILYKLYAKEKASGKINELSRIRVFNFKQSSLNSSKESKVIMLSPSSLEPPIAYTRRRNSSVCEQKTTGLLIPPKCVCRKNIIPYSARNHANHIDQVKNKKEESC